MKIKNTPTKKGATKRVKVKEQGRPALTDTIISAAAAHQIVNNNDFDLKKLVKVTNPAPGRGREQRDADTFRISGSREFILTALPFFKQLLDQTEYRVHIETHEKRTNNKPTGRYIAYVRFKEHIEPRRIGRPPKNEKKEEPTVPTAKPAAKKSTGKAPVAKKVATKKVATKTKPAAKVTKPVAKKAAPKVAAKAKPAKAKITKKSTKK